MARTQAYSYRRVSGTDQAKAEKDGLDRQTRAIRQYAKGNKITLAGDYADRGVTGTKGDRPALTNMLADLAANGVKLVLVEKADRLARDLMVSEMLLDQFRQLGVEVRDTNGTDLTAGSNDESAVLIKHMLAAVSQHDKTR